MPDVCNTVMKDRASDTCDYRTVVGHANVDSTRKARARARYLHREQC